MDEPVNWRGVAKRIDQLGRGARSRLAVALGMDRSQLARTLRKADYPRLDQAAIIDRFLSGQPSDEPGPARSSGIAGRAPLYGYAAGAQGDRIAFNEGRILEWVELPRGMIVQGEFFVVQTVGSSMEPRIWAGERKLVQRNVPPGRDQDAVIEFHDGTAVLKTYKRERDGTVFVQQYNPENELRYDSTSVKAMHALLRL